MNTLESVYSAATVWLLVGSQHLYGPEALKQVDANGKKVADGFNASGNLSLKVVAQPVLTTGEEISAVIAKANADASCAGVITWMHTFSPAKMWSPGLLGLRKPMLHLHTQMARDLPWATIDMDYMNLHQSAHGDREFGYICSRLGIARKIVAGHWGEAGTHARIDAWMRAVAALHDQKKLVVARIGDNMRRVAVTDGDKVEAEAVFGYRVDGYGVGDVVRHVNEAADAAINSLCGEYAGAYSLAAGLEKGGEKHESLRDAARIELGLRAFLAEVGADAFTDTFENLHGLKQLPGIAAQRLMADGFGFGAEGDWKTAALVRAMKVMGHGLAGGTSFMEDYTYHFEPGRERVLGAHMLEICPTIATGKPACECHPLGIGGKEDPVRLVFDAPAGPALNASMVDMGGQMRLIINEVDAVEPDADLPNLPVARAVWVPRPDFRTGLEEWIRAGGAHHTGYSYSVTTEMLVDFAEAAGIECVVIGD
ncbi:MAG: L-arabinose isomerase [Phycisphaeraceae bacterium]|nr:MAG: L-arabinose isomerase [Phycisphaeraceae bacterium]